MQVEFPISIGVSGAPGSGKQHLIDEFVRIAAPWFEDNGSELAVVPSPGSLIERDYDQAMGAFGSYVEDIWAFFVRYEYEQSCRKSNCSFISSSTAIDNIAHCGVNGEAILAGIATPDTQVRYHKQQVAMTTLSALFADRFRYTFGFYLPYKQSVILPGNDDFEAHYNQRVDQALQMLFSNFGMRIQVLDQTTFEEKAQEMFDTIKHIVENGIEVIGPGSESDAVVADDVGEAVEIAIAEATELPTSDEVTLAE